MKKLKRYSGLTVYDIALIIALQLLGLYFVYKAVSGG
jgi:hypothetical protein